MDNQLAGQPDWTYSVLPPGAVDPTYFEYDTVRGQQAYYQARENAASGMLFSQQQMYWASQQGAYSSGNGSPESSPHYTRSSRQDPAVNFLLLE